MVLFWFVLEHFGANWNISPQIAMSADARYFTDEFEHTIDSVNRLVIPAKWRTGQSEELYVFAQEQGRLAVLPRTELEKILHDIHSATGISANEKRDRSRNLFSRAAQVTCDRQGRITMEARLLKHAGLKSAVILVGIGYRFEIWNPKAWEGRKAEAASKPAQVLDEYGI